MIGRAEPWRARGTRSISVRAAGPVRAAERRRTEVRAGHANPVETAGGTQQRERGRECRGEKPGPGPMG